MDRPQIEDALGIMYLSYQQMHMADLAADTRRVLTLNYPNSVYLETSIDPNKSWFSGLFGSDDEEQEEQTVDAEQEPAESGIYLRSPTTYY